MDDARIPEWRRVPGLVHGFGRRDPAPPVTLEAHGKLFLMRQVHGTTLLSPPWPEPPEADASASDAPGILLGIRTADCLPILFFDPARRLAAAAHAGWRGTAAGISARVVEWFRAKGTAPGDLRVALGPCIGACCYEVGDELRAEFSAAAQRFFVPGRGARPHLDVRGVNEQQLIGLGVTPANIAHVAECTRCHAEAYHSYRRDGARAGRLISYIGWSRG